MNNIWVDPGRRVPGVFRGLLQIYCGSTGALMVELLSLHKGWRAFHGSALDPRGLGDRLLMRYMQAVNVLEGNVTPSRGFGCRPVRGRFLVGWRADC